MFRWVASIGLPWKMRESCKTSYESSSGHGNGGRERAGQYREGLFAHQVREDCFVGVETAGIGAKRGHNDPVAVNQEARARDAATLGAEPRFGVIMS